jgi:hypothetical protein
MDPSESAGSFAGEFVSAFQALQQRVAYLEGDRHSPSATRGTEALPPAFALPDTFSGDPDEDPATWTFAFDEYFELHSIDSALRVPLASSQLRGSALLWWRMHRQEVKKGACDPIAAWSEFCGALQRQFSPVNPVTAARNRLYRLNQRTSVAAYADEFRKLVLRIGDLSMDEQVNRFINGLKPHIRAQVVVRDPTRLDEAIRVADACDHAQLMPFNSRAPRYERRTVPASNYDPDAMQIDAVALQPLTPQQREQLRRTGGCFRCRKVGHLARDCPRDAGQRGPESGKAGAQ